MGIDLNLECEQELPAAQPDAATPKELIVPPEPAVKDTVYEFEFNKEQVLVIALLVWPLEQAWRKHLENQHAQGAKAGKLQRQVPRCVIIGGGGCGKTTIMQEAEDQMRKRSQAKQRHAGAWGQDSKVS